MSYPPKLASLIRVNGNIKASNLSALGSTIVDSSATSNIIQEKTITYYNTLDDVPTANVSEGTRAFVQSNQRYYIYIQGAWLSMAMANIAPTVSFDSSSYSMDSASDAILTLTAVDSDNTNLIYSYQFVPTNIVDSAITTAISGNQITLSSKETATGAYNFKVIGSVSDGISLALDSADISLILQAINGLTSTANNVDEGDVVTFNLNVTGYADGTTFPYQITGVTSGDLNEIVLSGTIDVFGGTAALDVAVTEDFLTEGSETITFTAGGLSKEVLINDTSLTPSYSLSGNTSVDEGSSHTFTLTYSNHPAGNLNFTVSNPNDITYEVIAYGPNSYTHSTGEGYWGQLVDSGEAFFKFTATADATSEGAETVTLTLTDKGISRDVTINDTSRAIYYSWQTVSDTTPDEGTTLSFTSRVYNSSETMYWSFTGTSDVLASSGTLTRTGPTTAGLDYYYTHSGSTSVTADNTTEGTETYFLYLRSNSAAGTVRATQPIYIQDTSTAPPVSTGWSFTYNRVRFYSGAGQTGSLIYTANVSSDPNAASAGNGGPGGYRYTVWATKYSPTAASYWNTNNTPNYGYMTMATDRYTGNTYDQYHMLFLTDAVSDANTAGNWRTMVFDLNGTVQSSFQFGSAGTSSVGINNGYPASSGTNYHWSSTYNSRNTVLDHGQADIVGP